MPSLTPFLNLTKPLQSEYYNVDIFNDNMEILDAALQSGAEEDAALSVRVTTAQTAADLGISKADAAQVSADLGIAKADAAQAAADAAQIAADNAQTAADNAQASADAAQVSADAAQDTADNAVILANNAQAAADNAQDTADTGVSKADAAQASADVAQISADNAQIAANNAQVAADAAQDSADAAQTTADTGVSKADAAQTAADTAQFTAELGVTKADSAQAAADTAQSEVNAAEIRITNIENAKGAPSGFATLDSDGHVPLSELSDVVLGQMTHAGEFDASTVTATLTAAGKAILGITANTIVLTNDTTVVTGYSSNQGNYYIVTVNGTFAGIEYTSGDWVVANDSHWGKVDNSDAVSSVQGKTGNVTLAPIDIGAEPKLLAGLATQYYRGDKTWQALNQAAVGLAYVTNESKATMFTNPVFTGIPTAPTAALTVNNTQLATTAFVTSKINSTNFLPPGGAMNQILTKNSAVDEDASWKTVPFIMPEGGLVGQILTKNSAVDGDASWKNPVSGVPSGGAQLDVLSMISSSEYGWRPIRELPSYQGVTDGQWVRYNSTLGNPVWANLPLASTTQAGVVQLSNVLNNASTNQAATTNVARMLNDKVTVAQLIADQAVGEAATAQTSANTANAAAIAAQNTANTAVSNAATAQTAADARVYDRVLLLSNANTKPTDSDAIWGQKMYAASVGAGTPVNYPSTTNHYIGITVMNDLIFQLLSEHGTNRLFARHAHGSNAFASYWTEYAQIAVGSTAPAAAINKLWIRTGSGYGNGMMHYYNGSAWVALSAVYA